MQIDLKNHYTKLHTYTISITCYRLSKYTLDLFQSIGTTLRRKNTKSNIVHRLRRQGIHSVSKTTCSSPSANDGVDASLALVSVCDESELLELSLSDSLVSSATG